MHSFGDIANNFLSNLDNLGHFHRSKNYMEEISKGLESGKATAQRSLSLLDGRDLHVLDVGCSWGPKAFGAASSERVAEVSGIDVEDEAVALGNAIIESNLIDKTISRKVNIKKAFAEALPFNDEEFDLIICNAVLEHVENVEKSVSEMRRVLKKDGVIHLVIPNYFWPFERHIKSWMLPMGPKWLIKIKVVMFRGAQGRDVRSTWKFIDSLNFVNPVSMEKIFKKNNICFENIYLNKLKDIFIFNKYDQILGLKKIIPLLNLLKKINALPLVYSICKRVPIYPTLEYKVMREN